MAITKVTLTISNLSHTFVSDVCIALVSPQGTNLILMSNCGGFIKFTGGATNVTLVFDDDAPSYCPTNSTLLSGTYKPTVYEPGHPPQWPPPAPALPVTTNLATFNSMDPDGTWNLFVLCDESGDSGIITGGWGLTISATPADIAPILLSIVQDNANVLLSWTNTLVGFTLQTTPSISGTPIWTNAVPLPVDVGGRFTVTNTALDISRFYRLAK
jgi:subtilisin-like proprotein convertase family protein